MIINKRCISAFSSTDSYLALASKSKLLNTAFSLTSELILVDYITGKTYPPVSSSLQFCCILWCESATPYLAAGHDNGSISIYERKEEGLVLVTSKKFTDEEITSLDYHASKGVLVAGSSGGKVVFWQLNNLEKNYSLDIPLNTHITALAWNPKVAKILCVGTLDGKIKVLDIKNNSIVMTLDRRIFTSVKELRWDTENVTKLIVRSEKEYLCVFDLSNDSVEKVGALDTPIIGFYKELIVRENAVQNKSVITKIKDAFECSISKKDPLICVSHADGTTEILPIPYVKIALPMCRKRNLIFTCNSVYKLPKFEYKSEKIDTFYKMLREAFETKKDSEIADYVLSKHEECRMNGVGEKYSIEVNLNDEVQSRLLRGDFDGLLDSSQTIDMKYLYSVIRKDASSLAKCTDFNLVFVMCTILNDYSNLKRIKNARVLLALLFYNGIKDYSCLTGSKEALCFRGMLEKDAQLYVDNRVEIKDNYLETMADLEEALNEVSHESCIASGLVNEYFMFKVFNDQFDDVKDLKIKDERIQYYIQMNINLEAGLSSMGIKSGTAKGFSYTTPSRAAPATPIVPPQMPRQTVENTGFERAPQAATPQPTSSFVTPTRPSFATPTSRTEPQAVPNVQNTPAKNWPFPASPTSPTVNTQRGFQRPNFEPSAIPQANAAFKPQPSPINPQSNFASPSPRSIPIPPNRTTGIPQPISQPAAPNAASQAPIFTSPSALNQSTSFVSKPLSVRPVDVIPKQQQASAFNRPEMAQSPPAAQEPSDKLQIIHGFEALIQHIKQLAATNNSLLIKQRKNQMLKALETFDTLDKNTLSSDVLEVMRHIETAAADRSRKHNFDLVVDPYLNLAWLKAISELIKMLY